jgi:predicted transcriptional regulator
LNFCLPKKVLPILVEKYDIANKIFNELVDLESRHILFSIIEKPKNVQEISEESKIPLSSVYQKIKNLMELSLILEAERRFSARGPIAKYYQSRIDDVKISISKFEPTISFTENLKVKK